MSFVHPGIAVVTMGLALVPLLIHLINRRRYRREPWAAMMFLLKAHRRSRRRLWWEQWLLLALRTLAVVLIGVAIARPYARRSGPASALDRPQHDRVIIVDDSLSMQARRADGRSAFEAAQAIAIDLLDKTRPGDGIGLFTASAPPRRWMEQPVHDARAVRRMIESLRCSARTTALEPAIEHASELLGRGDAIEGDREVYVITDMTKSSLPRDRTQSRTATATTNIDRLLFIDAGPQERSNLAISNLRCDNPVVSTHVSVRLGFDVLNHGDRPISGARVELRHNDRAVKILKLDPLPAGKTLHHWAYLVFDAPGHHSITASLMTPSPDALEIDNTCHLALHVPPELPVLLVEGDPGAEPARQSLFYCRVALSTHLREDGDRFIRIRTVSPGELEGELLGDYASIVLGNVNRLAEKTWARLERYVRAGGGLMIFLGGRISQDDYISQVASHDKETGVIPIQLASQVQYDENDRPATFTITDPNHPLLADFAGHDRGGLLSAHIRRYWRIAPAPSTASTPTSVKTILGLSTGDPALILARIGKGRVLIWAMDANMADGNFAAKPDYLPMMFNATLFVAGDRSADRNVHVGEALVGNTDATHASKSVTVTLPDGTSAQVQPVPYNGSLETVYRGTDSPGLYRMSAADLAEVFAVNIQSQDSDLRIAGEAELKRRFGPRAALIEGADDSVAQAAIAPPREYARIAMCALILVVLLETLTASSMGPRR